MKQAQLHRLFDRALARSVIGLAVVCAAAAPAFAYDGHQYIYTLDNQPDNRVVILDQKPDGSLDLVGSLSTHGTGSGAGLGSQGALALTQNRRWLLAVSAASNQITTFAVNDHELTFVATIGSGGVAPISVTSHGDLIYVLNAGGAGNITGFKISHDGTLAPIPGSTRGLGGPATGPAEVKFSNGGEFLVVSEKAANQLAVFEVADGVAQPATITPSSGTVPFGFDIDPRDHVIVSEAASGTVSSYELRDRTDNLTVITASLQTNQGAPCWLVVTPNGRYAYAGNAASGTITGFSVARNGLLSRLVANGVSASTGAGSHTIDLATGADGRFLYALANVGQTVTAFRIGTDGSLTATGQYTGVPVSTVGLVAR